VHAHDHAENLQNFHGRSVGWLRDEMLSKIEMTQANSPRKTRKTRNAEEGPSHGIHFRVFRG
jgi:hypothetical protein